MVKQRNKYSNNLNSFKTVSAKKILPSPGEVMMSKNANEGKLPKTQTIGSVLQI